MNVCICSVISCPRVDSFNPSFNPRVGSFNLSADSFNPRVDSFHRGAGKSVKSGGK